MRKFTRKASCVKAVPSIWRARPGNMVENLVKHLYETSVGICHQRYRGVPQKFSIRFPLGNRMNLSIENRAINQSINLTLSHTHTPNQAPPRNGMRKIHKEEKLHRLQEDTQICVSLWSAYHAHMTVTPPRQKQSTVTTVTWDWKFCNWLLGGGATTWKKLRCRQQSWELKWKMGYK